MRSKYFIRVGHTNTGPFEAYLTNNGTEYNMIASDLANSTNLYSVSLDGEEALSLRLTFPVLGFMNFTRTLGKKKENHEQD